MISYRSITNKGDRKINEDSVGQYVNGETGLFIVADGLGGHGAGNIASDYVVNQYLRQYQKENEASAERYFSNFFASVQSGLRDLHKDMKSTAAAVFFTDRRISVAHIGDTRVYIFGKKKILYKTSDHSVPQMLVNAGEIKEKDIRFHSDRNRLLRALGDESDIVEYDTYSIAQSAEVKGVLICSDGFWEYVYETDMLKLMNKSDNAEEWIDKMESVLRKNSTNRSKDNYSAIGILMK